MTPLLWAFPENKIERFKLLLEKGASPNVVVESDFNTRRAIIPGDSVTILAARSAFPDQLGLVIQHGGNPNIVHRRFKETPIHSVLESLAPYEIKKAKIEILSKAGADLNHMSVGRPPAMKSFNINGPRIVLLLIEAGADPCVPADNGLMQLVHFVARLPLPFRCNAENCRWYQPISLHHRTHQR